MLVTRRKHPYLDVYVGLLNEEKNGEIIDFSRRRSATPAVFFVSLNLGTPVRTSKIQFLDFFWPVSCLLFCPNLVYFMDVKPKFNANSGNSLAWHVYTSGSAWVPVQTPETCSRTAPMNLNSLALDLLTPHLKDRPPDAFTTIWKARMLRNLKSEDVKSIHWNDGSNLLLTFGAIIWTLP